MKGFWHRLAVLNAPFLAKSLREAADQLELLFPGQPKFGLVFLNIPGGEKHMGELTVRDELASVNATVTFMDAKGAATTPDHIPTWSSSDETVATVTPSDDGLSAAIAVGTPGVALIEVKVTETDDETGTDSELVAQGTLTVQPGDAVIGSVEFAPAA